MPPSAAVIETVAIASDREPTSLEPLYKTVDPDALDALLGSSEIPSIDGDITVSFVFAGHDVIVENDGRVVVGPVEPRSDGE
ncbi:HalOD1 output domain-containing protein [Haloprofundus halobius]|uniref:HalOD1 output domain-containing protein n=1 Tax=Haloprofundus halobius TaxID=2876194 RepID=UPI001CCE8758